MILSARDLKNLLWATSNTAKPQILPLDERLQALFSEVFKQPIRNANPSLPRFWYRLRKRGISWTLLFIMSVEYTLARRGKSHTLSNAVAEITERPPLTLAQFIADYRQHWITQTWV